MLGRARMRLRALDRATKTPEPRALFLHRLLGSNQLFETHEPMNKTILGMIAGAGCASAWWAYAAAPSKGTELLAGLSTAVVGLWVAWECITTISDSA